MFTASLENQLAFSEPPSAARAGRKTSTHEVVTWVESRIQSLLVIGVDAASIARSASEAGYTVFAADYFANKCKEIEMASQQAPTNTDLAEDKAYAISAVISSVAFLEAAINELSVAKICGKCAKQS